MTHEDAASAAQREAVASVYRNATSSIWFTVLVTWVVAYVLWGAGSGAALAAWAGLATVLHLARFAHITRRMRSKDFLDDPERDGSAIAFGLLLAGLTLALGFALFAAGAPRSEQYAVTLLAVGLSAGAITVLTGCRRAFLGYSMPPLVVLTGLMLWSAFSDGDDQRGLLGVLLTLYCVAIAVFQRRHERCYLQSLRLRYDREGLIQEKDALLEELQSLNRSLSADRDEFLVASLTDGLTGLANRRHFDRTLARDWERSRRDSTPLAFIMLDLDRFKDFNDRYGHMAGDDCLRAVAQAISETVSRGGDFAARYGGEEFVVLLPGTDARGASLIAERVRDAVAARAIPHDAPDAPGVVTLSAGVAAVRPEVGFVSSQALVDLADEALYDAKHQGRNRVVVRQLHDREPLEAQLAPSGG